MLTFIVNPNADGAKGYRSWKKLERRLIKNNIVYQAFLTGAAGEARALSAKLTAESGSEDHTIICVGGDGTMNEVLDGAHLSEHLFLGFIPTGAKSDLARGMHLPGNPDACLKRLLAPREIRLMDYGVVNYGTEEPAHRRFLVSCGCGFDASLVSAMREFSLRHCIGGPVVRSFLKTGLGLKCMMRARTAKGQLCLDEKKIELNHVFLLAAQIQPTEAGGMRLAPKALNADGELTVCILHNGSKLRQAQIMAVQSLHSPAGCAGVRNYNCRELKVILDSPMPLHADGENLGEQKEFTVRCVKQKLKVLC